MDFLEKWRLRLIVRRLAKRELVFDKIEIVPAPGGFFANIASFGHDEVISEDSVTGFAADPSVSFSKAISERVERLAFVSGKASGIETCQTERSDGFAAFPKVLRLAFVARKEARKRALGEAIERFVWARWWDDESVYASIFSALGAVSSYPNVVSILKNLPTPYAVREILLLKPAFIGVHRVFIFFCEMANGGFVSGGACGLPGEEEETITRAVAELFRHALAANRLMEKRLDPKGFYQERLAYFALGAGGESVRRRFKGNGSEKVVLPLLSIDSEVPHDYSDLFCVYRCLYENQPPFIGGALERFCL
jgi:hypothetical protein